MTMTGQCRPVTNMLPSSPARYFRGPRPSQATDLTKALRGPDQEVAGSQAGQAAAENSSTRSTKGTMSIIPHQYLARQHFARPIAWT